MKKWLSLLCFVLLVPFLTGCSALFGDRRYGEGDVVRVLINPAFDASTQFFVNLQIFNDSDEARLLRIEGFEYLDDGTWVLIPPIADEAWMNSFMMEGDPLQAAGSDADAFGTTMGFDAWLNPDYPTTGEFRARVRVYDLDGHYQFTQTSNALELQHFYFSASD